MLLLIAGVALFTVGAFPTDVEGAQTTIHGTVHGMLSTLVFTLGPVGMGLISYGYNRKWFFATLLGFVVTSVFAAVVQLELGAMGLAERGLIVLLLSWVVRHVAPHLQNLDG